MTETECISELSPQDDGVRPIIVEFQNGKLQDSEAKKLRSAVYTSHGNKTIAAVATKDILYTGTVNREEDLYNNFLLVRNKRTGKVRLIAVDSAILTPRLHKNQRDVPDSSFSLNTSTVNDLNKTFGSKRIKRMTEQKERLTMDIGTVKEQLEQTVAAIEVNESEMVNTQADENSSGNRPPINRDASTKEQVYPLEVLVPDHILNCLEEEANTVLEADLETLTFCPYIKESLTALQESAAPNRSEKCTLLIYLNYLIKFITTPAKNITKRFTLCDSKDVNLHILDSFSVVSNTGRTRPLSMRDKGICYILVLAMIASDYQVDIEAIAKDLKTGLKKLQEMGRILAFSQQGKNKNIMILKVPLPPPVVVTAKKRKR